MIHTILEEENGNLVQTLDEEAIHYLREGLDALLECEPGEELETPVLLSDPETGELHAVASHVLRRA